MPRLEEDEHQWKKELLLWNMNHHLFDPGVGNETGFLPLTIAVIHPGHGTHSFFKTEIPILHKIHRLKRELTDLIKVPADQQEWHYRGRLLTDEQTLFEVGFAKGDIITVKTRMLQDYDSEEDKLSEATCLE